MLSIGRLQSMSYELKDNKTVAMLVPNSMKDNYFVDIPPMCLL